MSSMLSRVPRLVVAFVMVGGMALVSGLNAFAASDSGTSGASVTLAPNGGWAAYHFTYPGDNSELDLRLMVNGPDPSTEVANAVTLDVYGPDSPPPGGTPIGAAVWTAYGERDWQFNSDTAGDYVVVVHDWDPEGRPVTVSLTTMNPDTGTAGPGLNLVSASSGSTAVTAASAPSPASPSSASAATGSLGATSATTTLRANGGWAAYHFTYPGDGSEFDLRLMVNAPDPSTEVNNAVTVDVYGPDSPAPGGTPIGEATWTAYGERDWQFNSDTAGDYVVVVHDWDPNGEPVRVTLSSLDLDTGSAGPALNFVSAGQ